MGASRRTQKIRLGPHVGKRQRPQFSMNPKREGAGATQSGRVASWERRKVKLWEEPDQKLVTDDVRGGSYSFWAEWHIRRRAHPSGYYKRRSHPSALAGSADCNTSRESGLANNLFQLANSTAGRLGMMPRSNPSSSSRCTASRPRSVYSSVRSFTHIATKRSANATSMSRANCIA